MKQELIKLIKAGLLCIAFCIVILTFSAMTLRVGFWANQKVYIYRLIAICSLCCVILLIASTAFFYKRPAIFSLFNFNYSTLVLCIGLSTVFCVLFFSLGPMVIERSYTVYSLADMTDHADVIYSAEDIKRQFIEGYVEEANESQKRIDEQVAIGNMKEVSGGYQITEKGQLLIGLFRFIESVFPVPDENSIYPNGK